MGLQFSISGQCNVSFEQVESATSRKATVDTRNVELYSIRAFTTKLRLWEGQLESEIMLTFLHYIRTSLRAVLHLFL